MELSQNYLFFWDKVERSYYNLETYLDCARAGEEPTGRLVQHLLKVPVEDGGQWDMIVNLIEKYGVMPKACRTESCGRTAAAAPAKTKLYRKIGPISPLDFYKQYVKPVFDMEKMVVVVNDPREGHDYDRTYTVDKLNNMKGARNVLYLNLPIQKLKDLSLAMLKRDHLVWFGCDVNRCLSLKNGYNDPGIHNFKLMMDVDVYKMDKATRLIYSDSLMTHAMTFTGCHVDRNQEEEEEAEKALEANGDACKAVAVSEGNRFHRWRVENSWGSEVGNAGYLTMTDTWFDEYVYEVVIDRSLLSAELIHVLNETEPIVLPAWDPMGALAL